MQCINMAQGLFSRVIFCSATAIKALSSKAGRFSMRGNIEQDNIGMDRRLTCSAAEFGQLMGFLGRLTFLGVWCHLWPFCAILVPYTVPLVPFWW